MLWTVLGGLFAVNVTFTIFAVALTRVAHGFDTTTNKATWVITAPLLCYGIAAPALGRLGDRIGFRRLYLVGMALSAVVSLLTAVASTLGLLIVVRAASGVVGAATGAASMSLIFRVFDHEDRVKAMGWWSLVGAGGPVIGVVIGGVLIEQFGWRSLFVVQFFLIVVTLVAGALVLPETKRTEMASFDWLGALAITVASLGLLLGLNEAPSAGFSSPIVLGSFAAVPTFSLLFVYVEGRVAHPLLPLGLFRRRDFSFGVTNQLASNFAYMGGFILAPLLLERTFGYDASKAGLTVVARPLVFSLVAPIAGYAAARVGNRLTATCGGIVLVASMLAFYLASPPGGIGLVVVALGLSGLALGLSGPSSAAAVANAVPDSELGVASSSQQLMSQIGTVAGIQVLQTVQAADRRGGASVIASYHDAYLVGAVAGVIAAVSALGLVSRRRASAELALRRAASAGEHPGVRAGVAAASLAALPAGSAAPESPG